MSRNGRATLALGVVTLAVGLLANEWVLAWLVGGEITSLYLRLVILLSEVGLLFLGIFLIVRRPRLPLATLATLAVSTAIALVMAELLLLAIGYSPRRRPPSPVPELVPWTTLEGGRHRAVKEKLPENERRRHNSDGYRDNDELTREAAAAADHRVLLLGDSYAYGASAWKEGESFAEILDDRLPSGTVVWNTGIPGYSQTDQLLVLDAYLPIIEPDVVVLAFYQNDFKENLFPPGRYYSFTDQSFVLRYERLENGEVRVLDPEEAYRRAYPAAESFPQYLETSRLVSLFINSGIALRARFKAWREGDLKAAPKVDAEATAVTRELLGEIASRVDGAGAQFLVFVIPSRGDFPNPGPYYRAAIEICRDLHIDYLEVRDRLSPSDYDHKDPLTSHWTAAGHSKASEPLISKVKELLAQSPSKPTALLGADPIQELEDTTPEGRDRLRRP